MKDQERLYSTLGELLYVVAMADGVIQTEEKEALADIFQDHPWAKDVLWSFNYEEQRQANVEEVYAKVISFCHGHGPAPEYAEFIDAMNLIAQAADGVMRKEEEQVNAFSKDLIARFQRDIERKEEDS